MKSVQALTRLLMMLLMGGLLFGISSVWADVTYDGSIPLGQEVITPIAKVFEEKTGIKVKIKLNGTEKGVQALLAGQADIVGVARSLSAEEKANKLYFQIVCYDAITVFVNAKNPVRDLTSEGLKKIFLGQTTNWKELGGADAPITIWINSQPGRNAINTVFRKGILQDLPFTSRIKTTDANALQHLQNTAADPYAISLDSVAYRLSGITPLAIAGVNPSPENIKSAKYPLGRPIHLVTKGLPKGDTKKFMDFILSPEGQEVVKKAFVPVH